MMVNIKKELKLAFSENKIAILISVAIFFISLILGYLLEPHLFDYFNPVVEDLTDKVESGVIKLTFSDIFLNNLSVILFMFISGLFVCVCAVSLSFNSFFVGYYVATSQDLLSVFLLIVPHGIFEFSSCILACSSGFVLFHFLCKFLYSFIKEENNTIKGSLSKAFDDSHVKLKQASIIFLVSVILMAIAGITETYLTLPIAEFLYPILS